MAAGTSPSVALGPTEKTLLESYCRSSFSGGDLGQATMLKAIPITIVTGYLGTYTYTSPLGHG